MPVGANRMLEGGPITNRDDLSAYLRLRFQMYCKELHSLDAINYPNGQESDWYDQYAVSFVIKDQGEVIGGIRLVSDTPKGFLMEEGFSLSAINRDKTVEYSRGIIQHGYLTRGTFLFLISLAEDWQLSSGFLTGICAAGSSQIAPLMRRVGWRVIGEKKEYHHITTVPMMKVLQLHVDLMKV